jgi:hypothetical protein
MWQRMSCGLTGAMRQIITSRSRRSTSNSRAEDDALLRILHGAVEGVLADRDGLGADQDALRIQAVQKIIKALAFLADAVLLGHAQPVDEDLVRIDRVPAHLVDQPHLDLAAVEIGKKQRKPVD